MIVCFFEAVVVGYAIRKGTTEGGRVEGESKTELVQITSSANEAEAGDAEIVLRGILSKLMVRERSSFRKRWGVVGENTLFISIVL